MFSNGSPLAGGLSNAGFRESFDKRRSPTTRTIGSTYEETGHGSVRGTEAQRVCLFVRAAENSPVVNSIKMLIASLTRIGKFFLQQTR